MKKLIYILFILAGLSGCQTSSNILEAGVDSLRAINCGLGVQSSCDELKEKENEIARRKAEQEIQNRQGTVATKTTAVKPSATKTKTVKPSVTNTKTVKPSVTNTKTVKPSSTKTKTVKPSEAPKIPVKPKKDTGSKLDELGKI